MISVSNHRLIKEAIPPQKEEPKLLDSYIQFLEGLEFYATIPKRKAI